MMIHGEEGHPEVTESPHILKKLEFCDILLLSASRTMFLKLDFVLNAVLEAALEA